MCHNNTKTKYLYIHYCRGALPPGPSHPGGLRPPDPLHLGGCAPKTLRPRGLRPPDPPLGRTDGRAGIPLYRHSFF